MNIINQHAQRVSYSGFWAIRHNDWIFICKEHHKGESILLHSTGMTDVNLQTLAHEVKIFAWLPSKGRSYCLVKWASLRLSSQAYAGSCRLMWILLYCSTFLAFWLFSTCDVPLCTLSCRFVAAVYQNLSSFYKNQEQSLHSYSNIIIDLPRGGLYCTSNTLFWLKVGIWGHSFIDGFGSSAI